jgi:hypothetical protein
MPGSNAKANLQLLQLNQSAIVLSLLPPGSYLQKKVAEILHLDAGSMRLPFGMIRSSITIGSMSGASSVFAGMTSSLSLAEGYASALAMRGLWIDVHRFEVRDRSPAPLDSHRLNRLAYEAIRCRLRFLTDRRQRTARQPRLVTQAFGAVPAI